MKLIELVKTLISYTIILLASIIFVPPCLIIACLPARYRYNNKLFYVLADWYYKIVVYASLNPVSIIGKQNLPKKPAIFVANHQSAFDIPLLGALCNGYPHVWLVMEYYIHKPILGFFIRRMFVSVDQSSSAKAARSLMQILRFLNGHKRHLLIFPEGGRYPNGVHRFFAGFAIIARKTKRPVVPVFMPNNGKIYPPHSFLVHSYPVIAVIGESFFCGDDESDEVFVERIRSWFLEQQKKYVQGK